MWCNRCRAELDKCVCEDIDERIDDALKGGRVTFKFCKICDKHWQRCKCEKPEWGIKGMGAMNN